MKAKELYKFLIWSLEHNHPVLIKGQPGAGKTDIFKQASQKIGHQSMIGHPVVDNPTDYKGLGFVIDGKAEFLPFGNLRKLLEATEPLDFLLDDLGQAPPAVQAAVMQLILAREINGQKISDYVRFVAATNRRQDMAGVSGILEPVKSRFDAIVELVVDADDWLDWAIRTPYVHHEIISFIRANPSLLTGWEAKKDIVNTPSPRTVAKAGKMLTNKVPSELEFEAIQGACGEAFALKFSEWKEIYLEIPTFAEIETNPRSAKVPNSIGPRFAVGGMMAHNANAKNIGSIITYSERMERELMVSTVYDCWKRNPSVATSREFMQWGVKYGQELVEI